MLLVPDNITGYQGTIDLSGNSKESENDMDH